MLTVELLLFSLLSAIRKRGSILAVLEMVVPEATVLMTVTRMVTVTVPPAAKLLTLQFTSRLVELKPQVKFVRPNDPNVTVEGRTSSMTTLVPEGVPAFPIFLTVIVYARALPLVTEVAEAVLVTVRSGLAAATLTLTVELLLSSLLSAIRLRGSILAVLEMVVPEETVLMTVTRMVTVTVPPATKLLTLQLTSRKVGSKPQVKFVRPNDPNVTVEGRVSSTTTLVPEGVPVFPMFLTVIVYARALPAVTEVAEAVLVTVRSGTAVAVSTPANNVTTAKTRKRDGYLSLCVEAISR